MNTRIIFAVIRARLVLAEFAKPCKIILRPNQTTGVVRSLLPYINIIGCTLDAGCNGRYKTILNEPNTILFINCNF